MTEYRAGDRVRDNDGDVWAIREGIMGLLAYHPNYGTESLESLERAFGPIRLVREYREGEVYEDRDGDRWTVKKSAGRIVLTTPGLSERSPEAVERSYGPLTLVSPPPQVPVTPPPSRAGAAESPPPHAFECVVAADVVNKIGNAGYPDFASNAFAIYAEAHRLLLKKQADYGPTNVSRSPGGPLNGLRVRLWDKVARLNNLVDGGAEPENESLRDTFLDLLNYGAIGLMVLDGLWPGAGAEDERAA